MDSGVQLPRSRESRVHSSLKRQRGNPTRDAPLGQPNSAMNSGQPSCSLAGASGCYDCPISRNRRIVNYGCPVSQAKNASQRCPLGLCTGFFRHLARWARLCELPVLWTFSEYCELNPAFSEDACDPGWETGWSVGPEDNGRTGPWPDDGEHIMHTA